MAINQQQSETFGNGLAESLQKNVFDPAQERQKAKLQLAMESSRLQQEEMMKQRQAQFESQLGGLKNAQLGAIAPAGTNVGNLGDLGAGQTKDVLGMWGNQLRAQAMQNKPTHIVTKPDHNNLVTAGFQNPTTGEFIGQPQTTLDPHSQQALEHQDLNTTNAINQLQKFKELALKVLPEDAPNVKLNELSGWFQQHGAPLDPDLKAFADTAPARTLSFVRDAQGSVPRNGELAKMDMGALPNMTDNIASALKKIDPAIENLQNKMATGHQIYDPTNYLKSPYHPSAKAQQQPSGNKIGRFSVKVH